MIQTSRLTSLNQASLAPTGDCVIYWMQKEQRAEDNWALLRAIEIANEHHVPVVVAFFVWELSRNAYVRHYDFMLRGLVETAQTLREYGIGFVMRHQSPVEGIEILALELKAIAVITDQSYLILGKSRRMKAANRLSIPLEAVDAGMIVPTNVVADKQLYAAYIARPKLKRLFDEYLTDYPAIKVYANWNKSCIQLNDQDVPNVMNQLKLNPSVGVVQNASGPHAANAILETFINDGINTYHDSRNDPVANTTSQLSAYLHYGQISSQRVAFNLLNSPAYDRNYEAVDGYLDELITWRELASNYCKFNNKYASIEGAPSWAQQSIAKHAEDLRPYIYTQSELEQAQTHDELWNAAQLEMVKSGRMHGYMRMYWAKKILEWTESPQQAIDIAIYLNDKYELDGREPGGYTGILWAIGGLHDRPWFEREIFGKIRFMSYNGAKGKFKIKEYCAWVDAL
jgi:deoxyribodipyrimidine photo-lyase